MKPTLYEFIEAMEGDKTALSSYFARKLPPPRLLASPKVRAPLYNFNFTLEFDEGLSVLSFPSHEGMDEPHVAFHCHCEIFSKLEICLHYEVALYYFYKHTHFNPEFDELFDSHAYSEYRAYELEEMKALASNDSVVPAVDWKKIFYKPTPLKIPLKEERKRHSKPPLIYVLEKNFSYYSSATYSLNFYTIKKEGIELKGLSDLKKACVLLKDLHLLENLSDKNFFQKYLMHLLQGSKREVAQEIADKIDGIGIHHPLISDVMNFSSDEKRLYHLSEERKLSPLTLCSYEDLSPWELKLTRLEGKKRLGLALTSKKENRGVQASYLYLEETQCCLVPQDDVEILIDLLKEKRPVELDESELTHFIDYITQKKCATPLNIEGIERFEVKDKIQLSFEVNLLSEGIDLHPIFIYGKEKDLFFSHRDPLKQKFLANPPLLLQRNTHEEKELLKKLEDDFDERLWEELLPPHEAHEILRKLDASGYPLSLSGKKLKVPQKFSFKISSGIDWIDLKGEINFEDFGVMDAIKLKSLISKGPTVNLGKNTVGLLPELITKKYRHIFEIAEEKTEGLRLNKLHSFLFDEKASEDLHLSTDQNFEEFKKKTDSLTLSKNKEFITPKKEEILSLFRGTLRDYQKRGVNWLFSLNEANLGGILADDMGLGKTIQVIYLLSKIKERRLQASPHLIVVPKSLIFNWKNEFAQFSPSMRVATLTTPSSITEFKEKKNTYDVGVITYHFLRNHIEKISRIDFDYLIIDEAQTIKNETAQITKAVSNLKGNHRLALTGTPVENSLLDLASIFEFIFPHSMTPSLKNKLSKVRGENTQETKEKEQFVRRFAHFTAPFILRRKKEEVLKDLPPKIENDLFLEFSENEEKQYKRTKKTYQTLLLEMEPNPQGKAMKTIEAILRLRQACLGETKVECLIQMIKDLKAENSKALVFSQFTSFLATIKKELEKERIPYAYLDGQTRNREESVKEFKNESCSVFLCSLKAGGVGLNLTEADYVFIMDPWWNPAAESQAIDRAHRIGQKKTVFTYRLIIKNSIEEKVRALQNEKRKISQAVLDYNEEGFFQSLSKDEIKDLFT